MEFRVLGPLEVAVDGRLLNLGGARQRAVLALFLTRANEIVFTDRLIDELWSGRPPRTAANTLQEPKRRLPTGQSWRWWRVRSWAGSVRLRPERPPSTG
jgi:hypothetical protein